MSLHCLVNLCCDFPLGCRKNLFEKRSFTEIASLQVVSQSVDFYQMSLLTSLRLIDLLSPSTVTAKRNQQFNASSAESFHRKLRAETLHSSNAPIQHVITNNVWVAEAYSPLSALLKHKFNYFRKRNWCYHHDWKLQKINSSLWKAAQWLIGVQNCCLPNRTDNWCAFTIQDEKMKMKSSSYPNLQSKHKSEVISVCLACLYLS